VWERTDVAAKDLFEGPAGRLPIAIDSEVACDFVPKAMSGWSEKFTCRLEDGTEIKVKYDGPSDYKEAYGVVLGTRLFWALGFYADRMIPAHVTCRGCPEEPFVWVSEKQRRPVDDKGHLKSLPRKAHVGTYRFDVATIEESVDAETFEQEEHQGWDWDVLEDVDAAAGGATRAEIDALKLLMAFVHNADNKASQNRLACPRDATATDASGAARCERPILYVHDLGSVFGRGGFTTGGTGRIDYEGWKSRRVWRDASSCRARLSSVGGFFRHTTLKDPVIGESGRALLADLLGRLSDRQIADLFRVARVDRLGLELKDPEGGKRPVAIDDWVRLFKDKRREITEHPACPNP